MGVMKDSSRKNINNSALRNNTTHEKYKMFYHKYLQMKIKKLLTTMYCYYDQLLNLKLMEIPGEALTCMQK